jgi:hypothetical protein
MPGVVPAGNVELARADGRDDHFQSELIIPGERVDHLSNSLRPM